MRMLEIVTTREISPTLPQSYQCNPGPWAEADTRSFHDEPNIYRSYHLSYQASLQQTVHENLPSMD